MRNFVIKREWFDALAASCDPKILGECLRQFLAYAFNRRKPEAQLEKKMRSLSYFVEDTDGNTVELPLDLLEHVDSQRVLWVVKSTETL